MIAVTYMDGEQLIVNAGLIETIEATPDTVITLVTGRKLMVRESVELVVEAVTAYLQRIGHPIVLTTEAQTARADLDV
jgi:flagellar protein FlbD